MKVIGAGLPRTGTLSQKVALEMLGFGPCYHMVNVLTNLPLARQWEQAIDGRVDWDEVLAAKPSTSRPSIGPARSSTASWRTPIRMPRWC